MTTIIASFISDFWNDQLVANELQGLFLVLAGFIGSFGFIRMSTRIMRSPRVSWWPGSVVSDSGVHLHHLVFGIVAMMAAGTLGFTLTTSPGYEISAALFGIGIGASPAPAWHLRLEFQSFPIEEELLVSNGDTTVDTVLLEVQYRTGR